MTPPRLSRSRLGWLLAAALVAGQLALVGSLVVGRDTLYLRDVLQTHGAFEASRAAEWQGGRLAPLDPYRAGGQPRWGNPNALPFYPTGVLQAIVPGRWSLNAHLWLHLLLAPWALAWLGRRLGLDPPSALVAGVFYGLSGFCLSHLAFANLAPGTVLAPALAAAWLACREHPSARRLAILAGFWTLILLGGDPLYAGLALVLLLVADRLAPAARPPLPRPTPRGRVRAVLALGAGSLVAAPQLGELWRILPTSYRGIRGFDAAASTLASWDPRQAAEWLLPLVFGLPDRVQAHAFWAEAWHQGEAPFFLSLAPGLVALALLPAAGWRRPAARTGWVLVAGGLFVALGRHNPAIALVAGLPGLSVLRFPVKAWLLVAPGLALLAATGWQALFRDREETARRRVTGAVVALGILVGALVLPPVLGLGVPSLADAFPLGMGPAARAAEIERWAATGGLELGLLAALLGLARLRRSAFVVTAGFLAVALHVLAQVAMVGPIVARERTSVLADAPRLTTGIVGGHWANGRAGALFGPPRVVPGPSVDARLLARQGAFSSLPFAGIERGFRYELDPSPEGLDAFVTYLARDAVRALDDPRRVRLLGLWGVGRIVVDRPLSAAVPARLERAGVAYGSPFYLYAIDAVPAVRRVAGTRAASTPAEALSALLDPAFDPEREVVIAGSTPGSSGGMGAVEVVRDEPARLDLTTSGTRPGWIVVERTWQPFYRAEVDGDRVPLRIANLHRIAIGVPAGASLVSLRYDEGPFRLELVLAGLGLLGLALLCLRSRERVVSSASP